MKNRIIANIFSLFCALTISAQSVYMHEAQEEAAENGGNFFHAILGFCILVGIVWLITKITERKQTNKSAKSIASSIQTKPKVTIDSNTLNSIPSPLKDILRLDYSKLSREELDVILKSYDIIVRLFGSTSEEILNKSADCFNHIALDIEYNHESYKEWYHAFLMLEQDEARFLKTKTYYTTSCMIKNIFEKYLKNKYDISIPLNIFNMRFNKEEAEYNKITIMRYFCVSQMWPLFEE